VARLLAHAAAGAGAAFLATWALAAAYVLKRALRIDIVPGIDVLPDEEIEALLEALRQFLGF
jgi:hypothetical protein